MSERLSGHAIGTRTYSFCIQGTIRMELDSEQVTALCEGIAHDTIEHWEEEDTDCSTVPPLFRKLNEGPRKKRVLFLLLLLIFKH
jgi:hypothetical protein